MIEKYVKNVRFCLICNDISKVTSAIQSRCTIFRFQPLAIEAMRARLDHVIEREGLKTRVTMDGKQAVLDVAGGDMRKVLNTLQSASASQQVTIDEDIIYETLSLPKPREIKQILESLLNQDFDAAFHSKQNIFLVEFS